MNINGIILFTLMGIVGLFILLVVGMSSPLEPVLAGLCLGLGLVGASYCAMMNEN